MWLSRQASNPLQSTTAECRRTPAALHGQKWKLSMVEQKQRPAPPRVAGRPLLLFAATFLLLLAPAGYLRLLFSSLVTVMPQPQHVQQPWCRAAAANASSGGGWGSEVPVTDFPTSFWFVKTFKTGGSTLAGVFRGISAHYGIVPVQEWATRDEPPDMTKVTRGVWQAGNASETGAISLQNHIPFDPAVLELLSNASNQQERGAAARRAALGRPPSELPAGVAPRAARVRLFTSLRHPLARVYSSYVQDACMAAARSAGAYWSECGGTSGGNAGVLAKVLASDTLAARWAYVRAHPANLNFRYLAGPAAEQLSGRELARRFDFIFLSERMNEALVIFMLEAGLTFEDVAHLSSKVRTGRYKGYRDMPDDMNAFLLRANAKELELWQAAMEALDAKRAALEARCGARVVDAALETFERLQAAVAAACGDHVAWYHARGWGEPFGHFGDNGVAPRCVTHAVRAFMAGAGQPDGPAR